MIYLINRGFGKITGGIFAYKRAPWMDIWLHKFVKDHEHFDYGSYMKFEEL